MPLTPLTPTVRNLGYLRLCRDDLGEIVDHVRSLANVTVDLEADNNKLTDVETDLPKLGDRLSYFALKTYKEAGTKEESGSTPSEILTLRLAREGCTLATTSPDLETRGVISAIQDMARERRRTPKWFPNPNQQRMEPAQGWWQLLWLLVTVASLVGLVFGISSPAKPNGKDLFIPVPLRIGIFIITVLALLFIIVGAVMSRTVLLTSLRSESPGWWKRNRDGFAVGMITGLITGLLTGGVIYLLTRP